MIIKIDNRETSRMCQAVKYYAPKHKIIIEELPIGDFLFIENKVEVVFEYKTLYDFRNSIKDGRIIDQSVKQQNNFKYHFIIVESSNENKNQSIFNSDKNLEVIANLNTFTTVLICPHPDVAFRMMEKQAQICTEQHPLDKKPTEKLENAAYNYLCLVNGIDKVKAHTICKHLKVNSFDDLKKITGKQLMKVPGIGSVTAQKVVNSIKTNQ